MKKVFLISWISVVFVGFFGACRKEFLNAKPTTDIVNPTTFDEFVKLLDNISVINNTTSLGVLSADEYEYTNYQVWQSTGTATERNSYVWAKDLFQGENYGDWDKPFASIFYANNVLSGLSKIRVADFNINEYNRLKGWALFVRSYSYFDLARNFAPIYDSSTASIDLGIPLKINPSVSLIAPRSTVQTTYDMILSDLKVATNLLPKELPIDNRNRPSKIAAHSLAARIFLYMRNYSKAEAHADSCLQLYNKLIDFNTLSVSPTSRFNLKNDELIYNINGNTSYFTSATIANNTYILMNPDLMKLYSSNDLRLAFFFVKQADGTFDPKRGLSGTSNAPFVGLAVDEVYLIKAECAARRNDVSMAMDYLNSLLVTRFVTGKYTNIIATSPAEALNIVLLERRKELVWRTLRWDDLKRLNKEGANITLTRTLNG